MIDHFDKPPLPKLAQIVSLAALLAVVGCGPSAEEEQTTGTAERMGRDLDAAMQQAGNRAEAALQDAGTRINASMQQAGARVDQALEDAQAGLATAAGEAAKRLEATSQTLSGGAPDPADTDRPSD